MRHDQPPEPGALLVYTPPRYAPERVVEFDCVFGEGAWRCNSPRGPGRRFVYADPDKLRPATKAESAAHLLLTGDA